ncbi:SusC/RagA family TonB-linked outer membrane protein [Chitinophaga sp. G-6-1-13]|uniref:SusC/RagA family TonB-linked outer membrane protein n=1 Tax=Chitinophaga fulva TaxID=2728842 RepID=A0A848GV63_9BACT|nr:SusC/RagA family TonB-linked outer membrane protein [Chitinophaga fulva]NML39608.1 SusC/RagA family TonB-linked outer membrane protein [Chitinophaga fulva]
MHKKLLLIALLGLLCLYGSAQGQKISGTVKDDKGVALPGVSIREAGTTNGTATSPDGIFTLTLKGASGKLLVSFMGFEQQSVTVGTQTNLRITLKPDAKALKDVVVIGYQEVKRTKSTAAVTSIMGKDIENLPAASVDVLLQGKLSGVNVQNFTGQPGVKTSLMVRGNTRLMSSSNFNGDEAFSNPLYVIDGIPISEDEVKSFNSTGTNFLASLNPNDIESIDILKDASAAAIYGSRGANGVIIIKTKKGTTGKARFSANAYFGLVPQPAKVSTVTGVEERRRKLNMIKNYGNYTQLDAQVPLILTDSLNPIFNNNNNWQDLFYQNGQVQNYDIGVSGANENVNYRVSMGMYDEKGVIINTGYKRYSLNSNLGFTINKKLELQTALRLSKGLRQVGKGSGLDANNQLRNVFTVNPVDMPTSLIALTDKDRDAIVNPYSRTRNDNVNNDINVNVQLMYHIRENLHWTTRGAVTYSNAKYDYASPADLSVSRTGEAMSAFTQYTKYLLTNHLTWNKTINRIHNFNLFAGQEFERRQSESLKAYGRGIPNDNIQVVLGNSKLNGGGFSDYITYAKLSYMASAHYDFKDKYLFDAFWRADASSRFGTSNKWGYFPSVSLGWLLHEESFIRDRFPVINFFKLRASYGINGDESSIGDVSRYNAYKIGDQNYNGSSDVNTYGGQVLITPDFNHITRNDVTWEQSKQFDLGTELELFQGRIRLEADWYVRNTSGQLLNVWVPETSGFRESLTNAAGVRNSGIEINLTTRNFAPSSKLQWTTSLNVSYNKNMVTKLPDGNRDMYISSDNGTVYVVGMPVNMYRMYITDGVINSRDQLLVNPYTGEVGKTKWGTLVPGYPNWRDINGDFMISDATGANDVTFYGDPNPKFTGGLTNTITYKNFTLQFLTTYTFGRTIVNSTLARKLSNGLFYGNATDFAFSSLSDVEKYHYWKYDGDQATFPALNPFMGLYAWRAGQSLFVEPGWYIRIKNVNLGYNFDRKTWRFVDNMRLSSLRVYGMMDNVAMFQKFSGIDAERVNAQGYDFGDGYPLPTKFTLGARVEF